MWKHSVKMNANAAHPITLPVGFPCLILLLVLTLAVAAFNRVVPKTSDGVHGTRVHVGWYLRNGLWQADMRTLLAAVQFIMDTDPYSPAGTNSPTNRMAMALSQLDPKSPDIEQVKDESIRCTNGCPPRCVESATI